MLKLILFLCVFSINIPLFYHSAFLAGFLSFLLMYFGYGTVCTKNKYIPKILGAYFLGYLLIFFIGLLSPTNDFSYIKTFTNMVLTLICAVPVVELYARKYRDCLEKINHDLVFIFILQTTIALFVMFNGDLKEIVMYFQRQGEIASIADQFSGGIRANFLSGPLFFGLSTMYAFVILVLFNEFAYGKIRFSIFIPLFVILNIGLMLAGRAGFVYIAGIGFIAIANSNKPIIYYKLFGVVSAVAGVFTVLYCFGEDFSVLNLIYNYAFEFVENYKSGGTIETGSTNELFEMYNLNLSFADLFLGHGLYTNPDGSYYMNTDVGYLRKMLYGGFVFFSYSIFFTLVLVWPMLKSSQRRVKILGCAFLILYTLLEFKGEAILSLVSLNTIVFIISYASFLSDLDKKLYFSGSSRAV